MKQISKTVNVFKGHIVSCFDLDSRDQYNVEVLINENVPNDKLHEACERAANKNDIVMLTGNSFEFEVLRPSGRVIQTTVIREEISGRDPEAEEILSKATFD